MTWLSRIFRRKPEPVDWDDYEPVPPVKPVVTSKNGASGLPQFATMAGSDDLWLHQRGGSRRSAFTPSQPVSDVRHFAGRAALLKRLIRAVEDQNLHAILYGDRGIGKTSILRILSELAVGARYKVHYTSCGEESEFSEVFRAIAGDIPLLYDGQSDPNVEAVEQGGTLADRLPDGDFSVAQLSEVFANISGTRILLILDEFDRAKSDRFRNAVAELIKNLSDRSMKVQLVIAGVASNLTDLIAHVPSIRRNIIGIGVPNMDEQEIRDLAAIATRTGGLSFSDAAMTDYIALTAGLPYLAALLGQHANLIALDAGADRIEQSHINQAQRDAREDIHSRLSPTAQFALTAPGALTPGGLLGRAAHDAVLHNGQILKPELIAELNEASDDWMPLLHRIPNDPRGAWSFVEDGTSSCIWLHTAQIGAPVGGDKAS